jgi:hypothetical protein
MGAKKDPYQTKQGNYLLRSVRSEDMISVMVLAEAGHIVRDLLGAAVVTNLRYVTSSSCSLAEQAQRCGMLELGDIHPGVGEHLLVPTSEGKKCLAGAREVRDVPTAKRIMSSPHMVFEL